MTSSPKIDAGFVQDEVIIRGPGTCFGSPVRHAHGVPGRVISRRFKVNSEGAPQPGIPWLLTGARHSREGGLGRCSASLRTVRPRFPCKPNVDPAAWEADLCSHFSRLPNIQPQSTFINTDTHPVSHVSISLHLPDIFCLQTQTNGVSMLSRVCPPSPLNIRRGVTGML